MVSRGKKITFVLSVKFEQVIPLLRLIEKPFMKLVTHNFPSNVTSHQILTFVYHTPRIYLTHSFVDEKVNTMYYFLAPPITLKELKPAKIPWLIKLWRSIELAWVLEFLMTFLGGYYLETYLNKVWLAE